jgi:hypothetical protein
MDSNLATDWDRFTTWLKRNLRDGNNGPIHTNMLYTEARQRPGQSPVEFHAYLLSLERDISMSMDGTSFMTRLDPELQNDILRTGVRPQERQQMVEHAQTIWLGRQGLAKLTSRNRKNDSPTRSDNHQQLSSQRGKKRNRSQSRNQGDGRPNRRRDGDRPFRRYRQRSNDRNRDRGRSRSRSPTRDNFTPHYQEQHEKEPRKPSFNLSANEYDRRKKEGLCFNCGQTGHRARECQEVPKAQPIRKTNRRPRTPSRHRPSN